MHTDEYVIAFSKYYTASAGIGTPLSIGGDCEQAGTIITVTRRILPAAARARCPLFHGPGHYLR